MAKCNQLTSLHFKALMCLRGDSCQVVRSSVVTHADSGFNASLMLPSLAQLLLDPSIRLSSPHCARLLVHFSRVFHVSDVTDDVRSTFDGAVCIAMFGNL